MGGVIQSSRKTECSKITQRGAKTEGSGFSKCVIRNTKSSKIAEGGIQKSEGSGFPKFDSRSTKKKQNSWEGS